MARMGSAVPWRGRRLALALVAFVLLLFATLLALHAMRDTEPRPRINPWKTSAP